MLSSLLFMTPFNKLSNVVDEISLLVEKEGLAVALVVVAGVWLMDGVCWMDGVAIMGVLFILVVAALDIDNDSSLAVPGL